MSDNGDKKPLPFVRPSTTLPQGVPIVGQPFTILALSIPVNATIACNCGEGAPATTVTIVGSAPTACPTCGKVFLVAFNPTTGKVEMRVGMPKESGEVS